MNDDIIRFENVKKYYPAEKITIIDRLRKSKISYIKALDNINIDVMRGTVLGIVGESGSGKTTIGKIMVTLESPTGGNVYFDGSTIKKENLNDIRNKVDMVFQNPYTSLNPRLKVKELVSESVKKFDEASIKNALENVGIPYEETKNRTIRELSGGQIQRVAIAKALIKKPELIVLDEPTSALDESIQAQILNILVDIQKNYNLTYVFITHNINVARYISDYIAVVYTGKIVEYGPAGDVLSNPQHPYTKSLISSIPSFESKDLNPPVGEIPSLINLPKGCTFNPRCPFAMEKCRQSEPKMVNVKNSIVACWLYE